MIFIVYLILSITLFVTAIHIVHFIHARNFNN